MVQFKYVALVLSLLLPLVVGLRNPTLLANKELTSVANNGQALETLKEVHHKTEKIAEETQGTRLRGRKIEAEDVPRSKENTGKDTDSSSNSYGTSNEKVTLEIQETQDLLHETAEIFKMMKKDYHTKAYRRPPIHNNLPLKDHEVESP